jgi:hypothetical protein
MEPGHETMLSEGMFDSCSEVVEFKYQYYLLGAVYGFLDETNLSVFGFLHLSPIICECHLIPAFTDSPSRMQDLLAGTTKSSLGRPIGEADNWAAFYVML